MFEATNEWIPDFLEEVCAGLGGLYHRKWTPNIVNIFSTEGLCIIFEYDPENDSFVFTWHTEKLVKDSEVGVWKKFLHKLNISLCDDPIIDVVDFSLEDGCVSFVCVCKITYGGEPLLEIDYIAESTVYDIAESTVNKIKSVCSGLEHVHNLIKVFNEIQEKNEKNLEWFFLLISTEGTA